MPGSLNQVSERRRKLKAGSLFQLVNPRGVCDALDDLPVAIVLILVAATGWRDLFQL